MDTDHALITIIIPIYNAEAYLETCLASVSDQTYKKLEILLIDDGSTDRSEEIYQSFATNDDRIRIFKIDNAGVSAARNVGLNEMNGQYVAFIDADDFVSNSYIEYLFTLLSDYKADVATCLFRVIKEEKNAKQLPSSDQNEDLLSGTEAIKEILYSRPAITSGPFCKLLAAHLFDDVRFDTAIAYAEDLLMNYTVFSSTAHVAVGNQYLYSYRHNPDGAMRKAFSIQRMSGLVACKAILAHAHTTQDASILKAATTRLFMESVAVLQQIPMEKQFESFRAEATDVLKSNRRTVLFDHDAKTKYRVYALAYTFGTTFGNAVTRRIQKSKGSL